MTSTTGRNRLAKETSPYLLQHAANPVDWYPWGEEAIERARAEGKPILLSVGYSSCHWCHVMAHESFENDATAAAMNRDFVNIKVDREERPDIDGVYMTAVQALTGQGGWPMTVFMTPELKPFYAGTYFPPDDAYGKPGFPRLLEAIAERWRTERGEILQSADGITAHLERAAKRRPTGGAELSHALTDAAAQTFAENFDAQWGGFGMAPKFPSPSNLEFLLSHYHRTRDQATLQMVLTTLRSMATGGMYDQLGGGFARYSVDERWLVPHFEKMLYDNAQLVRLYLHAWQITREPLFERIVRETLAFLEREMLDPEGGFYAALDADSEGIEAKYYVWTVGEVEAVLGEDAALFIAWFGVTPQGNFRDPHHPELTGRNVLTNWQDPEAVAAALGIPPAELPGRITVLRSRMLAARDQRVRPGLDDKVLTSWNGLALAAFAEAARVLGDSHYRELAERNAVFVRTSLWRNGELLHTYKAGQAKVKGLLEDYAYYGLGLIELYRLTGDLAHLQWGRGMFATILELFHDDGGGFFEAAAGGEDLLIRQKALFDGPSPSGNGAAALFGLWLARYFGGRQGEEFVGEVLSLVHDHLIQAATGFGSLLQGMELSLAPHREVAIVGPATSREPFERELGRRYEPWLVIAGSADGSGLPLFEGREAGEAATAYVCEDMACQLPARDLDAFRQQLDALS